MFKLRIISVFTFLLFTVGVAAKDIYIAGGDNDALQTAITEANTPGSQVIIHLEAGQKFEGTPYFYNFSGNLEIKGNGAIFGLENSVRIDPMGTIANEGTVTITGASFNNFSSGLFCSFIRNQGKLTLERVTFSNTRIETNSKWVQCDTEELLLNSGTANLVNVTFIGTAMTFPDSSIIRTLENASTNISHLTVVDTVAGTILRSATEGSISVSNSIFFAGIAKYSGDIVNVCNGPITDNGGNFDSTGDCGFSGGLIDRDSLGQNVEKGHDAWVVPLFVNSTAVNAADPASCQGLDGRGFERGALCDSGSYQTAASNHGGELGRGGISGLYFTPATDGNYIQVQRAYDGNVVVIWNTFDTSGTQAWVYGVGGYQNDVVVADAYRNLGGVLQPGGGASTATATDWGTLKVTVHDCINITVEYESSDPDFGSGTFEAQRIAYVHDLGCSEG